MIRPEWLAKTIEAPLEPELPIIDPHHHLWDMDPAFWGRYLADDLLAYTTAGHRIVGTVFVDCQTMYRESGPETLRPVGETEYVESVANRFLRERAERPGICAGIVSHADLLLGDRVVETLDAWLYHPQIPELTSVARRFPETTIVLDHLGGPLGVGPYAGRREEIKADWKRSLAELATCSNVFVKIGGLVMEPMGFGFSARPAPPGSEDLALETRDYVLHAIDCFGPERCMFESNFPVDKLAVSYGVLWNAFKRISRGFEPAERASLFRGTAARAYRLELPAAR
ncbi:amidohydrolase family protein [Myxococcota bacterium]|nr:amidohydrolase family protein [Myxococcota bacterium]